MDMPAKKEEKKKKKKKMLHAEALSTYNMKSDERYAAFFTS